MKIRTGFVSNSSSSSFIIYYNKGKKELKKKLEEIFDISLPENFPIKMPLKGIGETVYSNISETFSSVKAYMNEFGYEEEDECDTETLEHLKKGGTVYMGGFADDTGELLDQLLCNSDIHYEDEEITIHQHGGY